MEVLVSITLFFIVMGAVVGFYALSAKTTTSSQEKTVAVRLAQQAYERTLYGVVQFDNIGTFTYDNCTKEETECKNTYTTVVNNRLFYIEYEVLEKNDVNIYPIIVNVNDDKQKKITSISGFIEIDKE
nr:hypothetical protein [Massilibacterium senegalense]